MIESKTGLTLFFIHTTSTCIVRLGDICNALRYSNQYLCMTLIESNNCDTGCLIQNLISDQLQNNRQKNPKDTPVCDILAC